MQRLEAALKQLEAEYNMYFAGRLPKPPWETRSRVAALVKQYDKAYIQNYGDRFRFATLQARYQAFVDLWDKGLKAREEGRASGPFAQRPVADGPGRRGEDAVKHTAAFKDPTKEMDKLHSLYDSLMDARRKTGEDPVPFHKFAALVKDQVSKLREAGNPEVAFRVAVKDGKVNFTARAMRGVKQK